MTAGNGNNNPSNNPNQTPQITLTPIDDRPGYVTVHMNAILSKAQVAKILKLVGSVLEEEVAAAAGKEKEKK